MTREQQIQAKFEENVANLADKLKGIIARDPDRRAIAHEALLKSDAFLIHHPVIVVTGVTHTGKSSLINAIFGEERTREGLTADTTDMVIRIKFKSGLLIYDTPGAGGIEVKYENITRAFLGLKQLDKDADDNDISPINEVPTIDPDKYDAITRQGIAHIKPKDFQEPNLFIFVLDGTAGALKREDRNFFREVVSLGKPVIVVVNKIDNMENAHVQQSLEFVHAKLDRAAIAVSAKKGKNIDQLVATIVKNLPLDYTNALGQTVDKEFKKLVRYQTVALYSVTTAVKNITLVGQAGNIDNSSQWAANILGLYAWIINQYGVSESQIRTGNVDLNQIGYKIEEKLGRAKSNSGQPSLLFLAGSATGALMGAVSGVGFAIAIGGLLGGLLNTASGTLYAMFKRERILDSRPEMMELQTLISSSNKYETMVNTLAFGLALRECCNALENSQNANFSSIFDVEYDKVKQIFETKSAEYLKEEISKRRWTEEKLIKEVILKLP